MLNMDQNPHEEATVGWDPTPKSLQSIIWQKKTTSWGEGGTGKGVRGENEKSMWNQPSLDASIPPKQLNIHFLRGKPCIFHWSYFKLTYETIGYKTCPLVHPGQCYLLRVLCRILSSHHFLLENLLLEMRGIEARILFIQCMFSVDAPPPLLKFCPVCHRWSCIWLFKKKNCVFENW